MLFAGRVLLFERGHRWCEEHFGLLTEPSYSRSFFVGRGGVGECVGSWSAARPRHLAFALVEVWLRAPPFVSLREGFCFGSVWFGFSDFF